ncbi:MAG: nickel pincer cofactor biosynthesis protein LarC [bacterium]
MKKYIRFDSVGGASGDMILSALAALGADIPAVEATLNAFFPERLHFHTDVAHAAGLNGLRVTVRTEHPHPHDGVWPDAHGHGHPHTRRHEHRGLMEIEPLLSHAPVSEATRDLALAVFRKLAEAEAKIHGSSPETVHFHEIGAWDSVADIVGACLALEQLGVSGVSCGPLPAGTGTIRCAHGEMPNPAPATLELLAGMTMTQTSEPFELVTPTGAALLRVWTHTLALFPSEATVIRSAFGFGSRTLNGRPNVLRATLLAESAAANTVPAADLLVLETHLDDCNPEWLGTLAADLLERGALDVWLTPVIMKKGRPGTLLSVLADASGADALRERIFRSTTTFGIRFYPVQREALDRRFETVRTPWGDVPVKIGSLHGEDITASPEHDACALLAQAGGITPRQVYEAAKAAYVAHPK